MSKRETIYLSQLEELTILWPRDIHALAEFVLRCYDARDRRVSAVQGINQTSRPTLHGLVGYFSYIADIPKSQIEAEIQKRGLHLAATVEFDPINVSFAARNVLSHDAMDKSAGDQ